MKKFKDVSVDALKALIKRRGLSKAQYGFKAGFEKDYIYYLLRKGLSPATINRVCLYEGMEISEFLRLGEGCD